MEDLADILEQELERAFEVKDRKSLSRYVKLLTNNIIIKNHYERQLVEMKSEIRLLAETMKEGFRQIEKRFEAVDKRFEDMNKRFNMMFAFMNIGFGIIILITILFKFMQ